MLLYRQLCELASYYMIHVLTFVAEAGLLIIIIMYMCITHQHHLFTECQMTMNA